MTISKEVKVGVFVMVGLAVMGVVVFLIGDQRHMFERHIDYHTSFNDVQGLNRGAPVHMNGINVGTVTEVAHSSDLADPRIHVKLWLVRSESLRLRADAKAKIINKGLLGDKMLEVLPGSADKPPLAEKSFIEGVDPTDFSNLVVQVESIAERTNSVLGNLDKLAEGLAEEDVQKDIKSSIHSLSVILKEVGEGKGYANRLLTDPAEAERISRTLENVEQTSHEASLTAAEIRQLVSRVNRGPGFAHNVVYSNEGTKTIEQMGSAAGELATTLKGIREGDGLAHGLLYGGDEEQGEIFANLNAASRDLRDVMAGVKSGKGTVGALLVDPSIYEDMKAILGNVERNQVLRSLVRYSIKRDERSPRVEVRDSVPPPATSAKP